MESNNDNAQTGVFLNGKAQIIEMLKVMSNEEREKLLKNVYIRNPQLAGELMEGSISFRDIDNLKDHDIRLLAKYVNPQIMGIALKDVNQDLQRRVLSLCERSVAESAYSILTTPITDEKNATKRAQSKILLTLVQLSKRGQINL